MHTAIKRDHKTIVKFSETPPNFDQYIVYKELKIDCLYNGFYLVFRADSKEEERNLIMLKQYVERQGFQIQQKVFSKSQAFANFFISSNISKKYILLKNLKYSSLIEYFKILRQIPINAAIYFFKTTLRVLIDVSERLHILHKSLYPSDILINDDRTPIVSGWSKLTQDFNERDLVFDCGTVLFFLVSNGGLTFDAYLNPYKSTRKDQAKEPINFQKRLKQKIESLKTQEEIKTILNICLNYKQYPDKGLKDILSQSIFQQQLNEQEIKQDLRTRQKIANKKMQDKQNEKLNKLFKRQQLVKQYDNKEIGDRDTDGEFVQSFKKFTQKIQASENQVDSKKQQIQNQFIRNKSQPHHLDSFSRIGIKSQKSSKIWQNQELQPKKVKDWAFIAAGLQSFIKQNIGTSMVFPQNQVKLQSSSKVIVESISLNKQVVFHLKLDFEAQDKQGSDQCPSLNVRIRFFDENCKITPEVIIQPSQCHQLYLKKLKQLLEEEIRFLI